MGHLKLYEHTVSDRVPSAMRQIACLWLFLGVSAISLLSVKKTSETQDDESESAVDDSSQMSLKSLCRDKRFLSLYAMNFCTVFYGYLLIGSYKVFGSIYINNDMFLTTVGSVSAIFGSMRFIWSVQLDCGLSYPRVYGALMALQLVCSLLVHQAAVSKSKVLFTLTVALTFFCEGGHFVLLPAHCADVFGSTEKGVKAFSFLFSCFGLSSIMGGVVQNVLLSIGENDDSFDAYDWLFKIAAALTVLAMVILISYSKLLAESQVEETDLFNVTPQVDDEQEDKVKEDEYARFSCENDS